MNQPDKNRFLSAIRRKEPDRVPLCEFLIDTAVKEQFIGARVGDVNTGENYSLADDIRFWAEAGYDFIHIAPRYGKLFPTNWRASVRSDSLYDDKKRAWAEEGYGPIRTPEDMRKYPWPEPQQADFTSVEEVARLLPGKMGLTTGTWGIFEMIRFLTGFEGFCYLLLDNEKMVGELFERVGFFIYEVFKRSIRLPNVVAAWFADDLASVSGPFISPDVYRRHLFPWMRRICEEAQAKNIPVIYHCDGNIESLMDELIDLGFAAIQPFEPKAMDIAAVKRRYGNRIAVIGNIDLGSVLTRGTPAAVTAAVRAAIKSLAPGGGYLLGSSNSITNYVPLDNYRAMLEATLQYGRYPISM